MTDSEIYKRLNKLETEQVLIVSRWESEFGNKVTTGNLYNNLDNMKKEIKDIKLLLQGNGKLGLTSKVNVMWSIGIFVITTVFIQAVAFIKIIIG